MKTPLIVVLLSLSGWLHAAVHLNPDGLGQVLIYPYYTVNNDFNTIYTITNTTPDTKAIKIQFIEGMNGKEVLDFNVYLDGYDSWQGILLPTTSTLFSHAGEPSGLHVSADNSCAPFLNPSGQEFLPFSIDTDPPNTNMQRSREGHIQVIEMATFLHGGPTETWADHGNTNTPNNCAGIQADWDDNGFYDTGDEERVSGGLTGHASLVDVSSGQAISYQATAIDQFWRFNEGSHSEPGSLLPGLRQADRTSSILINQQIETADWSTGIESLSSILQAHQLVNEFDFDPLNNTVSEWVINFPTKTYHVDFSANVIPPFSELWNGNMSCDPYSALINDRDQQTHTPANHFELCLQTNVIQFLSPGSTPPFVSQLLGSRNLTILYGVDSPSATLNGWARLVFDDPQQRMNPDNGPTVLGLPALGFQVKRFSNAQAQPGLLARYTQLTPHVTQRQMEVNP